MTTGTDIIHAYRHLYRACCARCSSRRPRGTWRATSCARRSGTRARSGTPRARSARCGLCRRPRGRGGLEHRVLKNLLRVRLLRAREGANWRKRLHESKQRNDMKAEQETAMEHYDMTVAMLNKSMGLCLR
ncbi:hypothetical protein ACCO45_005354 [Purpureocillium lilacinum]|uniref:Uncharacterized protein n=1 Tax=Purpureocillium lilacinum TaxID=33203 RepID=A0ACC4DVW2_PURLI